MNIGYVIYHENSIKCPTCGNPMRNRICQESAFLFCICMNPSCKNEGVGMLIEKSTMSVLWMTAVDTEDGMAWPMLANKDGKQVWPKKM